MPRALLVLVTALVCAGLTALVSTLVPPEYSATARLVASAGTPDEPAAERAAADQVYARTFAELLGGTAVAERVAPRLMHPSSPAEASQRVSFTAVQGTAVVEVTAEGPDPRRVADLATTWATVSAEEGAVLVGVRDATLTLGSPAPVPSAPERPRPLLYSGMAAAGGALLAILGLLVSGLRRRPEEQDPGLTGAVPASAPPARRSRLSALVSSRPSWLTAGAALVAAAAAVLFAGFPVMPVPVAVRILAGLLLGALAGGLLALVLLVAYDRTRDLVLLSTDAIRATGADVVVQTTEPRRLHAASGVDMRFRDLEPFRLLYRSLAGRPELEVVVVVDGSTGARAGLVSIDVAVAGANAAAHTILVGTGARGHRRTASGVLRRTLQEDDGLDGDLVPTDRPHLRVLPIDWPDASDSHGRAALMSRQLPLLVDRLRARADFVVLSSPSLSEPEVTLRLAEVADASLLVMVAGASTVLECRRAADRLARVGCRVVGVVLIHRGGRQPAPIIWTRPPRGVAVEPPVPAARPASHPREATELAASVRTAGTGGGKARNAPAPRSTEPKATTSAAPEIPMRPPAEEEP